MYKVMGIDLGTTNSVVAVVESGTPEIIINAEGNKTTPSVVFYPPDGECVVGELAKRQEIIHPERTIRSIKRFMGCRWEESEEKRRGILCPLTQTLDLLELAQVAIDIAIQYVVRQAVTMLTRIHTQNIDTPALLAVQFRESQLAQRNLHFYYIA